LIWDAAAGAVVRKFDTTTMKDDADLQKHLADAKADHAKRATTEFGVTIDAAATVPWADVVAEINRCKRLGITKVEFAFGNGK